MHLEVKEVAGIKVPVLRNSKVAIQPYTKLWKYQAVAKAKMSIIDEAAPKKKSRTA